MESGTYDASYSEVFEKISKTINELNFCEESADGEDGKIIVSTRFSVRSWGERITIQISKEDSKTRVTVCSVPKAQLFDWGKSRRNERRIIRKLNSLFEGG